MANTCISVLPQLTCAPLFSVDFNLTGTVPTELARLESLQVLSLQRNRLEGTPPSELGLLQELKQINLEANLLTGDRIPLEWFALENLTQLHLGKNRFTAGPLSTQIGQLTKLQELDLTITGITGTLPTELFQLTDLSKQAEWNRN